MPRQPVVTGLLALLLVATLPVREALSQGCPLIVEGTRWLYHPAPPPVDWEHPGTPDDPEVTPWVLGCAPFGSPGCGFSSQTGWPVNATFYLRQHVFLTGGEFNITARVAIDNDFELFINGVSVGSLAKEGCATRWDAVIPIPDALWVPGDNVVAVRIVDRGGIATFELMLDAGASTEPCPSGCATLPCGAPGPEAMAPPVTACPNSLARIDATATWPEDCPDGFVYRFTEEGIRSSWGGSTWWTRVGTTAFPVLVEARCSSSATCPVGPATEAFVLPSPVVSTPLGPVLRVARSQRRAELAWPTAPPLAAGDSWEVSRSPWPARFMPFTAADSLLLPRWTDSVLDPLVYYLVHSTDPCGRRRSP